MNKLSYSNFINFEIVTFSMAISLKVTLLDGFRVRASDLTSQPKMIILNLEKP